MKTNRYTLFCAFVFLRFFALSLLSCSTEDVPRTDDDYGYIYTTVRTPNTLDLTDEDDVIHTIRIFVFVGDLLETQKLFVRGEDEKEWKNSFRLRVATGTKNVMVVANETAYMTTQLEAVRTRQNLYDVEAEHITSPFTFAPSQGLPMTGKRENVDVAIGGGTATVTLTKMVAKLDITIIDGSERGDITITEITLFNNKGISLLWDRSDGAFLIVTENDFFDIDITVPKLSDRWVIPTLYLYENLRGQENPAKATRLEIAAVLQLDNGDTFPVTYSVYINEHLPNTSEVDSPENQRFLIQRGHHYTLTGTIWGTEYTHITVKMEVKPWQAGNSSPQRPLPQPEPIN